MRKCKNPEVCNNKLFVRTVNKYLAQKLGKILMHILHLMRQRHEKLYVPASDTMVPVIFSDIADDAKASNWMTMLGHVVNDAINIVCNAKIYPMAGSDCISGICIAKGLKGKSILLGDTFVFSLPKIASTRQILVKFINDLLWLSKRNACYYNSCKTAEECRKEASRFTEGIMRSLAMETTMPQDRGT